MKKRNVGLSHNRSVLDNCKEDKMKNRNQMDGVLKTFGMFFVARFISAIFNNINDCDETFNYWEPAHFLLYKNGFQTWEYSPKYAIRSYAYLWLYMLPAKLFSLFVSNKVVIFYLTRLFIAFICSTCETFLSRSIAKTFNVQVAFLYCLFSIFSCGLFTSTSSFLPSSFGIYITCLTFGFWFHQYYRCFIFFTAFGAIFGWPFTAAISLPMAIYLAINKKYSFLFVSWSIISAAICIIPVVLIDSYYYGKFVFASLNILLYNVFSTHGPNIYGTEPFSYYFLNLFLNFNLIFMISLLSIPILLCLYVTSNLPSRLSNNIFLTLTSLYLWFLIFFLQPHKEERFMYPVYPLICLLSSIVIVYLHESIPNRYRKLKEKFNFVTIGAIGIFIALSISRIYALYNGYNASLNLFYQFYSIEQNSYKNQVICLGKEWHRFPSNFFIPENVRVEFVASEFRGELPKHFNSSHPYPTRLIPENMNDENKEEISRYVNLNVCDFIVDSDYPEYYGRDYPYSKDNANWTVIDSFIFLDSHRSSKLARAFYIPILSNMQCVYINYNLLANQNKLKSLV